MPAMAKVIKAHITGTMAVASGMYDVVLVHMNQEYILIAGWLWKYWGKPIYMWRNHYAGSWLTDIAAAFCTKVFSTSKHSYTAKYRKNVLMPVGVDTKRFTPNPALERTPRSILSFGRIAPSKRLDIFIEALGILLSKGISFVASVYGSARPADSAYYENLKSRAEDLGLHDRVRFYPGVPSERSPDLYCTHEIFVNCSPSGMYDKTIFEAAASGCLVLAASDDFREVAGESFYFDGTSNDLAKKLSVLLGLSESQRAGMRTVQRAAESNGLLMLASTLSYEMTN